jgi:soluble lytic murein transglycosylase-like protein
MSPMRGYAAPGQPVLKTKPAKTVMKWERKAGLLLVAPVALSLTVTSLALPQGRVAPPLQQKPDAPSHINLGAIAPETPPQTRDYSPLRTRDTDLYRDIFRLQASGAVAEADALIAQLGDNALMGHVLAQRYLHTDYKVGFAELKDWLKNYADHPQAARIERLAAARRPEGDNARLTPASYGALSISTGADTTAAPKIYKPQAQRSAAQNAAAKDMIAIVRRHIQIYEPSYALKFFNENPVSATLDTVEKDRIRALIAAGYLYAGKTEEALKLSARALAQSAGNAPMAGWVHGLSLWRLGQTEKSAASFEMAAGSPYATGWMASAAAYWAARAHQSAGQDRRAVRWLEKAAHHPKTFYGMLALSALDKVHTMDWQPPRLSSAEQKAILETRAGLRAEKLLAAGQVGLAEDELRGLYAAGDKERKHALLAYAYDRGLPALSMALAHSVESDGAAAALYPEMPWAPHAGYRIDRALLHAIARQESRFNAIAENKLSGATGLMQIMPRTAMHVSGEDVYLSSKGKARLKNPETSLDIGQKYIEELLNSPLVGQDLLSLAIAYNAGPGRLARWKAERADITDPLLFIETIPFAETRAYVERVLANYWIYRMKFDQPNDSIVALNEGKWARYAAYDKGAVKFADAR